MKLKLFIVLIACLIIMSMALNKKMKNGLSQPSIKLNYQTPVLKQQRRLKSGKSGKGSRI